MTKVNIKYLKQQGIIPLFNYNSKIDLFVVIPVFADELIFETLKSLSETDFPPKKHIGVIVVINHSENANVTDKQKNEEIYSKIQNLQFPFYSYPIFKENISKVIAGVGYARKVGMDQAANFFYGINNPQGIIVSLDADTTVSKNYFTEIIKFFKNHPDTVGANIHFEHPLYGSRYSSEVYKAITLYELHLRYFVEALRYINFPYAFQTVGSAFSVRAKNYVAAQGISTRQGGEDFYFLNKLFYQGFFGEINTTCVFPSPRPNNKTPFGTGIAVQKILENSDTTFMTYNFNAFLCIKELFDKTELLWQTIASTFLEKEITNPALQSFLQKRKFCENVEKLKQNATSLLNFKKAFFRWFDLFAIIKFLNKTAKIDLFPKQKIVEQANRLVSKNLSAKELLLYYRKIPK